MHFILASWTLLAWGGNLLVKVVDGSSNHITGDCSITPVDLGNKTIFAIMV